MSVMPEHEVNVLGLEYRTCFEAKTGYSSLEVMAQSAKLVIALLELIVAMYMNKACALTTLFKQVL